MVGHRDIVAIIIRTRHCWHLGSCDPGGSALLVTTPATNFPALRARDIVGIPGLGCQLVGSERTCGSRCIRISRTTRGSFPKAWMVNDILANRKAQQDDASLAWLGSCLAKRKLLQVG